MAGDASVLAEYMGGSNDMGTEDMKRHPAIVEGR